MKKSYLMIAAAAALFAACSDTDTFKDVVNEQNHQPFTFTAFADKVTKAPNTNSSSLQDFYTVFGVYGFKNVTRSGSATSETVFSNVPNEYFAADDISSNKTYTYSDYDPKRKPADEWGTTPAEGWYYEDVRYWDKTANSYEFFAIAPYEDTPTYTVAAGAGNISIATSAAKYDISTEHNLARTDLTDPANPATVAPKAALTYSGFKKDYMLAEKSAARTSDVMLNFHHILSKLNVKIEKASSYVGKQELTINELKIDGLAKEGYYTYQTSLTTNGWTTGSTTYPLDVKADYSLTATTNYSGKYWIETLIFPQTATCMKGGVQSTATALTDKYLYVKYSIGTEIFEAYYDLAYVFDKTLVYTAAEAIAYNAALDGALNHTDGLTSAQASAYNAAIQPETDKAENNVLSEEEAAAYNATLTGAVAENDLKAPNTGYTFNPGSQYNLTLTVGPEPIHFDATVSTWTDVAEVIHTVD
jgi:hypothetical protein